jgi:uncharacterized membrane protein YbaN (DUF454 family)
MIVVLVPLLSYLLLLILYSFCNAKSLNLFHQALLLMYLFAWKKREIATGLNVVNPNMETL